MATDPTTGLTDKQARFCREYLACGNAAGSYQKIYGCSPKAAESGASRMLRNGKIQAYLTQLRQKTATKAEVTLERTLEEIARIAFSDVTRAITFSSYGMTLKDSESLPPEVTAAIESITVHETETSQSINRRQSLKMHNKMAALQLLSKYFGLDDDFNSARQCLRRYGLSLLEDPTTPAGWRIDKYEG